MKKLALLAPALAAAVCISTAACAQNPDAARWQRQAQNITIIRDDWGIAHVYGKTDADAVFGMIYAQAEDDFNRVETNYLTSLGRRAEAEGEARIYDDLRAKMYANPDSLRAMFARSPEWLKTLMVAWADGLNFYLTKHPAVKPRVITRFEPWMALSFSEGSIGGDIESISIPRLRAFYGKDASAASQPEEPRNEDLEPRGSNGIAIAPSNTVNGNSLLLINPHTSFYFRSELQMVSEEGLNAYGAATWGQFFLYQGFNANAGWMHTSSGVDNIDEFAETIVKDGDRHFYMYGGQKRSVITQVISVPYKTATGMARKDFTVYRTHHGPIVREADGKWVSVTLMDIPVQALMQSYGRTKSRNIAEFRKFLDTHSNSSNNTLFADNSGNVAYFHANYIPKRDPKFDWTKPVDGSDPATDYKGVLSVDESPNAINPASGWAYNSNNWPWTAAGPSSPRKENFPAYVESGSENPRGVHAIRLLKDRKDFTRDGLLTTAFDSYLPAFEDLIPALAKSWDATPASSPLKAKVADQLAMLRTWDFRWSATSVPTSLAVFWGEELFRLVGRESGSRARQAADAGMLSGATDDQRLRALATASDKLTADFGKWQTPWGDINRFQRVRNEIVATFDDALPSIPVMFTSARWGSLASFGARQYSNTKKWYGTSGNSFVAVVEFGKDSVRARAVTAGGESGNPASKHFNDQATRYATGDFRTVYYYRSQLTGHMEREYHPGQ
jgi:acyl-homoserine lactone acylase PvdQ